MIINVTLTLGSKVHRSFYLLPKLCGYPDSSIANGMNDTDSRNYAMKALIYLGVTPSLGI
ncbi:MAG: hypothetical protein CL578_15190 [Alteromonadaceae bacterium]|nr:hypothetical protein [Alteromonadaceae bacterium]